MAATFEYLTPRPSTALLGLAPLAKVVDELRGGGLAVLPTETGYMLAALATSEDAIESAFRVKQRDVGNVMHVACSSLDLAREVGQITPIAERLLGVLTPGPITVVVRSTGRLPTRLVTFKGTVGIRVPDHPATLQVISALGLPVTATSLNRAGEPSSSVDRRDLEQLDWPDGSVVYVVEDDKATRYTLPSTLVRVTGSALEVLRCGPIDEATVDAVARTGVHRPE